MYLFGAPEEFNLSFAPSYVQCPHSILQTTVTLYLSHQPDPLVPSPGRGLTNHAWCLLAPPSYSILPVNHLQLSPVVCVCKFSWILCSISSVIVACPHFRTICPVPSAIGDNCAKKLHLGCASPFRHDN